MRLPSIYYRTKYRMEAAKNTAKRGICYLRGHNTAESGVWYRQPERTRCRFCFRCGQFIPEKGATP